MRTRRESGSCYLISINRFANEYCNQGNGRYIVIIAENFLGDIISSEITIPDVLHHVTAFTLQKCSFNPSTIHTAVMINYRMYFAQYLTVMVIRGLKVKWRNRLAAITCQL